MKKEELDLSLIKESDLDKTAAFEDLMTRSERKKYLEEKQKIEDKTVEFHTADLMEHIAEDENIEEKINQNSKKKNKKKKKEKPSKEIVEDNMEEIIDEKVIKEEEKENTSVIDESEDKKEILEQLNISSEDEIIVNKPSVVNNVILSLLSLGITCFYVYLSTYVKNIDSNLMLFISINFICTIFGYALASITVKKLHILFSVFTYLFDITFIALNVLIYFKII